MYSVTRSFGLNGLSGFAVAVEADISGGLPAFSIVGLPDSAVRESADRVRAAIKNLGFKFPDRRITINLAPADVRKTGPVYDLPLLLAVLTASGQLEDVPADAAFLGELALDGTLRPVSGVLPMALAAAENGTHALYVPAENAAEAAEACADSMAVYPAHTAREVVDALRGISPLAPAAVVPFDPADAWAQVPDFADVMGQSLARRAMVIAAAGPGPDLCTAFPQSAPLGQCRSSGWRRRTVPARRVQPCQLRCAVFRRIAGVLPRESGSAAPAAGGRPDHREPSGRQCHLSQPLPAGSRHEPL